MSSAAPTRPRYRSPSVAAAAQPAAVRSQALAFYGPFLDLFVAKRWKEALEMLEKGSAAAARPPARRPLRCAALRACIPPSGRRLCYSEGALAVGC